MIASFFLGFLTGFLLSIPIGPINLTVIRESLHGHPRRGFMVGLGGVLADAFYCSMAFLGFSSLLDQIKSLWPFLQFGGGVVVFLIGLHYTLDPKRGYAPMVHKVEASASHFHKAFPLGFFMGISNISLFVLWGGVNTLFVSNGWVKPDFVTVLICVIGIALGSVLWFASISSLVSKMHYQFGAEIVSKVTRVCGILLVIFGILLCVESWSNKIII